MDWRLPTEPATTDEDRRVDAWMRLRFLETPWRDAQHVEDVEPSLVMAALDRWPVFRAHLLGGSVGLDAETLLARWATFDEDDRLTLATRFGSTPPAVEELLVDDPSWRVRAAMVDRYEFTDPDWPRRFLRDAHPSVRECAERELEESAWQAAAAALAACLPPDDAHLTVGLCDEDDWKELEQAATRAGGEALRAFQHYREVSDLGVERHRAEEDAVRRDLAATYDAVARGWDAWATWTLAWPLHVRPGDRDAERYANSHWEGYHPDGPLDGVLAAFERVRRVRAEDVRRSATEAMDLYVYCNDLCVWTTVVSARDGLLATSEPQREAESLRAMLEAVLPLGGYSPINPDFEIPEGEPEAVWFRERIEP